LWQVFDAPLLVKKALANTCGLHLTYCVAHDDTDMVKRLMEDHGVRSVFTTEVRAWQSMHSTAQALQTCSMSRTH
jgi:hypothetical protein